MQMIYSYMVSSTRIIFKQIYSTLTGSNTPSQSRPGSNSNERVLNTGQTFGTGASPSNAVKCHTQHTLLGIRCLTPEKRDTVNIF